MEVKSAGVIVTYNRKELLAKNICMQLKQDKKLDRLYIIDNHSTDNTFEYLQAKGLFRQDWMDYIFLEENTGGAGGFHYGLRKAYHDGYDFIWLMDDDGRPYRNDTWLEIYRTAKELYQTGEKELLLNCLVTVEGRELSFGFGSRVGLEQQWLQIKQMAADKKILDDKANLFNGTLVTRETVEKVGYPNKEFFMKRDETDYFRRCVDAKVRIGTVLDSIYHHPRPQTKIVKILSAQIAVYDNMDQEYYATRNTIYSYKRKHKARLFVMLFLKGIVLLKTRVQRKERLLAFAEGIKDGVYENMGRRDHL